MRRSQPWKTNRARALRENSTSAEEKLWRALRDRRLDGRKFTRQVAIGPYFADFACRELKVIVEIDGATHGEPAEIADDRVRTAFLSAEGYRVFRVYNDDVFTNLDGVLEALLAFTRREPD